MKAKLFGVIALCLVALLAICGAATAVPVTIDNVKIDGTKLSPDAVNKLSIERGDEIDVKVTITASEDAENLEVEAFISGYEYNDKETMSDTSHVFDVEESTTYVKNLELVVPSRVDDDSYKLRVIVSDRNGDELIENYNLKIDAPRHQLDIRDVVLDPEQKVEAGSALLATVRVKNMGDRDEDSVKVNLKIPGLGLSDSDYIDEIEDDDSETSPELYLPIPKCADAGVYDVEVSVEYDDGEEVVSESEVIEVVESGLCVIEPEASGTTEVVVGSTLETVSAGEGGAVFPITVTNNGGSNKAYTVSVSGAETWGTVKVSPTSTMIVKPGKTESFYIFVSANDNAEAGQQVFTATVSAGSDVNEQIALTANIVDEASGWDDARKGLEIALVVLIALLVIIALIVGFNKLKGEDDLEEEGQTYY